jgi:prolipoprotein diacylglyceryltransferase
MQALGWPVTETLNLGWYHTTVFALGLGAALATYVWGTSHYLHKSGFGRSPSTLIQIGGALGMAVGALLGRNLDLALSLRLIGGHITELPIYGYSLSGAAAGAVVGLSISVRIAHTNLSAVLDGAAAAAPLSILVGRLMNLLDGRYLGKPTNVPFAFQYRGGQIAGYNCAFGLCERLLFGSDQVLIGTRHAVYGDAALVSMRGRGLHPTALYDALVLLVLAVLVRRAWNRVAGTGLVATLFLAGYAAWRLAIDSVRLELRVMHLTLGQYAWASVLVLSLGGFAVARWRLRGGREDAASTATPAAVQVY